MRFIIAAVLAAGVCSVTLTGGVLAYHFSDELEFLNQLIHTGNSRCRDPQAETAEELICQHFRDSATGTTYFLAYLNGMPWKVWRRDGEAGIKVIWPTTRAVCRWRVCV